MPAHKRSLPPDSNANGGDDSGRPRRRRHLHHNPKRRLVERPPVDSSEEEEEDEEEEVDTQEEGGEEEEEEKGGDEDGLSRKKSVKEEEEAEEAVDEEEGDGEEEDGEAALAEDEEEEEEAEAEHEDEEREDSDGSSSSASDEKPEFVYVKLAEIRKDVQCPICLGIIKKTRTVMECLHRFCRECIDKSMRLGNNECPACRKHCASRRSLRDDPNFDALISALYPDIDKYEEEELAFHEEEKTRNKEIQASIAQILLRQNEALSKRRTIGKDAAAGFTRPRRNLRTTTSRRRRNATAAELLVYEYNEDNNEGKDSSSADEHPMEVRQRKKRKRTGARSSRASSSADIGCAENENDATRDTRGISPGLVWNPEMFAWGKGGTRSNTRHGGANGSNKNARHARLSKLTEHLRNLDEGDEANIDFLLVCLDEKSMPSLKLPYVRARSSLSVGNLREYVARQIAMQADEVEILVLKSQTKPIVTMPNDGVNFFQDIKISDEELQLVEEKDTLANIISNHSTIHNQLILAYRQKEDPAVS